MLIYRKKIRM